MENLLIATFADAADAGAGLNKMKELDELGDIVLYNMVLVRKTDGDTLEYLYHQGPDFENLPAKGLLIGSLIGLIAGPLGLAIGAFAGLTAGAIDEDDDEGLSEKLLDKISHQLKVGEYAVIADMEEDTPLIIDTYLGENHGTVVRTDLTGEFDKYDDEQLALLDAEIDAEEADLRKASAEHKAAIEKKIGELKEKRAARHQRMKERLDRSKQHLHDKISHLNQKIAAAHGAQKEKLTAYNQKVKARLETFNSKLASAFV